MNADLLVSLPNMALDDQLIPCPECHAEYNIPGTRLGPTTLGYTQNSQRVVCLNCGHKGKTAKTQQGAMENWNSGQTGNNIRILRKAAGLTQQELADLAGLEVKTVWNLESGKRSGSNATRGKIAGALGVAPKEL